MIEVEGEKVCEWRTQTKEDDSHWWSIIIKSIIM